MSTRLIGIAVVMIVAVWASVSVQHDPTRSAQERRISVPGADVGDFPMPAQDNRFSVMPRRDVICMLGRGAPAAAVRTAQVPPCA
jgi:hypothetical protein